MRYNAKNAAGSQVFVLDPLQRIDRVVGIDTTLGILWQVTDPLRLDENGEVLRVERRFAAIWPIFVERDTYPVLFHCYGEH